ncbi:pyridoxamine kinase [Liquorilactobacillus oeni]|uniref:pyridoxal kinase n=1 Tax=Liquorilactobacillus oeni DSM 19972 TaxID=1423777 RepID=A0A0R1MDE9_9LACO|nr:pyridoxamine kinase [Liquorilactobacillus oeni]KRL05833.1 Pyridoxal kinase [Liquorilactobacillus oeni DSM 19972]
MTVSILISQDLSCAGQVSMTVALPILGALGLSPTVLPTALLSTHTGGFGENTYYDLSSEMEKIIEHWKTLPLSFSAIYLGYLGAKPLDVLFKHLPALADNAFCLIDPVMGDHGKLYRGFNLKYVAKMRRLITHASLITPNVTEAQLLLGKNCTSVFISRSEVEDLLISLKKTFSVPRVLLTGVQFEAGSIGVWGYDDISREIWHVQSKKLSGHYFGTGDLFASVLLGALLKKRNLQSATKLAMGFVSACIEHSLADEQYDPHFGPDYSQQLPLLLKQLN